MQEQEQDWFIGRIKTQVGDVPRVSTSLAFADLIGAISVRLSIGRMNYSVEPGLYAVGNPDESAPVMVSANYKLSFDALRRELGGVDAWILVLDTKGVNVWCAAGKGTFGTEELVARVKAANLENVVTHRQLILPQLSAPGVAAHLVKKACGFSVIYGPVRARDIKAFVKAGMKALPEMRIVRFDIIDRLVVVPVELVQWFAWALLFSLIMLVLSGISRTACNVGLVGARGVLVTMIIMISYFVGGIVTPCLLPWLPGRAFSLKGIWVGSALWGILVCFGYTSGAVANVRVEMTALLLLVCAITSFMARITPGLRRLLHSPVLRRKCGFLCLCRLLL